MSKPPGIGKVRHCKYCDKLILMQYGESVKKKRGKLIATWSPVEPQGISPSWDNLVPHKEENPECPGNKLLHDSKKGRVNKINKTVEKFGEIALLWGDDSAKCIKAIKRFETDVRPMGIPEIINPDPQTIEIKWPTDPVPESVQKAVGKLIVKRGEFGFLSDHEVEEIASIISEFPISLEQALSLRSAINQEKSVYSHHRIMDRKKELKRRYENGADILELAKFVDGPPVNVFRAILSARNMGKNRIKTLLKEPKMMDERDQEQFKIAEEADRVSNVDQTETHIAADLFEDVLCNHFEALGIRFRRQEELVKEQVKSEGRPVRTPDLLFLDDVRINGFPCAWIDAKHFFGSALSFPRKKTQKQIDRYTEEYGQGAIIYRHGFCDGLKLRGAQKLDAGPVDLSILIEHNESRL